MISLKQLSRYALSLLAISALAGVPSVFAQAQKPSQPQSQYPQQQQSDQNSGMKQQGQADDGDFKAATKVKDAPDVDTTLKEAAEYVKKYSKSNNMKPVANLVVLRIDKVQDPAQKITYSQTYLTLFKDPALAALIQPVLIDGYIKANRLDEAYQQAATDLNADPDDVILLTKMSLTAYNEVRKRDNKFVKQGIDYGDKAITLIEANKKPGNLDDQTWNEYRTVFLANLYQGTGLFLMLTNDSTNAMARLQKSLTLSPNDPFTYVLMGSLTEAHYQDLATKYKSMSPGPAQDDELKQALTEMDKVIDFYAHSVGLAEGQPQYQPLHDQILQTLTTYYKFRHNSTDGMDQLIAKYKKPATPPGQ